MLLMISIHVPIFSFVPKILQPYLVAHQTDKPMIHFFYQELSALIRKIIEIIVKPKVLSDCNAATKKRIDLYESSSLLNDKDVNIGFDTTKMLLDLQKKYLITVKECSQFLKDSKHFIISLLSKLFERIPLGSVIVICSFIFNPVKLVVIELDNSKRKMKKLLNFLVKIIL